MSNYSSGHAAEVDAAHYLQNAGYHVRELNWKTRYCEIDIVAEKAGVIYFVEVKSRQNNKHGFAAEYVGQKKLTQMRFAAELWVTDKKWRGEYQLAVIAIDAGEITFIDVL